MNPEAPYVLYAPQEKGNGVSAGSVLCIKTESGLAFIGFANEDLAEEACIQLCVGDQVRVVALSRVEAELPIAGPRAEIVVVIPDSAVLAQYLDNPQKFPIEKYFVRVTSTGGG